MTAIKVQKNINRNFFSSIPYFIYFLNCDKKKYKNRSVVTYLSCLFELFSSFFFFKSIDIRSLKKNHVRFEPIHWTYIYSNPPSVSSHEHNIWWLSTALWHPMGIGSRPGLAPRLAPERSIVFISRVGIPELSVGSGTDGLIGYGANNLHYFPPRGFHSVQFQLGIPSAARRNTEVQTLKEWS